MITNSIFLAIYIHIGSTKLREDGTSNVKYDTERRLCEGCISLDWGDDIKIKEAITINNDNKDEVKDPWKKNG